MNRRVTKRGRRLRRAMCGLTVGCLMAPPVWAADGVAAWRPTYDAVMVWVNFAILVALLIKVLRKPLKQFFADQGALVTRQVDAMLARKEAAEQALADTQEQVARQSEKMDRVRELLVAQGQREKRKLIDDARDQARTLLKNAQQRAESRVREAGQTLKNEMIDAAFAIARQQLPQRVQPQDQQRWLQRALEDLKNV